MTSTAVATLLRKQVEERFGKDVVFQDVANISPGDSFPEKLAGELANAKFTLALFEDDWLTVSDRHGLRLLDSESDWVRRELAYSLSEPEITVIPVLIGPTAGLPTQQNASVLPAELQTLVRLHRVRVNDSSIERDMAPIIDRLEGDLIPVASDTIPVASDTIPVSSDMSPVDGDTNPSPGIEPASRGSTSEAAAKMLLDTAGPSIADRLADFFFSRPNILGMAGVALALAVGLIWPISALRLILTAALCYAAGLLAASVFDQPDATQSDSFE